MYASVFPARLKKAREYNGLTQDEVAKTIKINRTTYTNYEAGRNEPNLDTLAMLSRLYNVKSDWLIGITPDSGLNSMRQVLEEREREKILKKLEKEAELNRRVWG